MEGLTLERNRELAVLLAVVTGLGSTFAAHAISISPALGAFIAGMFLGASPFATQIRADISSLRVVLLTLFFGAAGMVADPLWIISNAHIVLGVLLVLTLGKAAIVWGIFRVLKINATVAASTGICLAQIGEFAFVLGKTASDSGVIGAELHRLIVSVAIVSLFASPFLVPVAGPLGTWLMRRLGSSSTGSSDQAPDRPAPDVVIIGFGPAGQVAADALVDRDLRVVVVDLNRYGVRRAETLGFEGHVGDVTQSDVLEHARIAEASVVVITVPHHETALTCLRLVSRLAPQAHTVVRSRYQRHTADLVGAGAATVFGDEEEMGARLGCYLGEWLGGTGESSAHSVETVDDPVV